jgi:O-antigen ligase
VFTFLPDANTMTHERLLSALSTGVENSFVQAMLRTGLVGFALLVAAYIALIPSARLARPVRNHAAVVLVMMVIGCFVNSSLESPLGVVGMGFCYGYLYALNATAPARMRRAASRQPLFTGLTDGGAEPCPRAARLPG